MLNVENRRKFLISQLLTVIITLGAAMNASAAWEDLDTSFGTGGQY